MERYCLGLIRSLDLHKIVLIKKQRPAFQRDCFNGIGGKLEADETAVEAMVRECREECALTIPADQWHPLAELGDGTHYHIHVFQATHDLTKTQTLTDEEVVVVPFPVPDYFPLVPDLAELLACL